MKIVQCEGYPETTCPFDAEAVYDMLGYQLCEACADNWRKAPTREDQRTGATIVSLRAELAVAHEALGAALALIRQQSYSAAEVVIDDALKGKVAK
jgi:hypothetical protein